MPSAKIEPMGGGGAGGGEPGSNYRVQDDAGGAADGAAGDIEQAGSGTRTPTATMATPTSPGTPSSPKNGAGGAGSPPSSSKRWKSLSMVRKVGNVFAKVGRLKKGKGRKGGALEAFGARMQQRATDKMLAKAKANASRTKRLTFMLFAYLALGALAYTFLERDQGWTYSDGLYFSCVTISTVGFGDLNPGNGPSRVFTVVYGTFGIFVTFVQLTVILGQVQTQAVERVRLLKDAMAGKVGKGVMAKIAQSRTTLDDKCIALCSGGTGRMQKHFPTLTYYLKGAWLWLVTALGFQFVAAAVYVAVGEGQVDFPTALWHCWVTAATVGYGAVASELPATPAVRLWAAVHVILGVTFFATTAGHIMMIHGTRKAKLKQEAMRNSVMDEEFLDHLDRDGNGVDRMEYVIGMLAQLGMVNWSDVQPFLDQFDKYDVDRSGKLDREDLERMITESRQMATDALDRQVKVPAGRVHIAGKFGGM